MNSRTRRPVSALTVFRPFHALLLVVSLLFPGLSLAAPVFEAELDGTAVNNSPGTAQAIPNGSFTLDLNPNIFTAADGGFTGTAITVSVTGHTGGGSSLDVDFYSFTMLSNSLAWLDIDGAPAVGDPDSIIAVFDSTGTLIAVDDDSFYSGVDPGTAYEYDSFIGAISLAAGTYYIAVSEYQNFPVELAATLNAVNNSFGTLPFDQWFSVFFATPGNSAYQLGTGPQSASLDYVLHISQIVPEPSSMVLAALGLIGLGVWSWRRKR